MEGRRLAPPMLSLLARTCRRASPSPQDGESGETCLCGLSANPGIPFREPSCSQARLLMFNEHPLLQTKGVRIPSQGICMVRWYSRATTDKNPSNWPPKPIIIESSPFWKYNNICRVFSTFQLLFRISIKFYPFPPLVWKQILGYKSIMRPASEQILLEMPIEEQKLYVCFP